MPEPKLLTWWEKTVEYQFVLLATRGTKLFLAPLDGDPELTGDAIFSRDYMWVLIEFKKDLAAISTERKKFYNYSEVHAALSSWDTHHHIIYGEINKVLEEARLELHALTYFSGVECKLGGALNSGVHFDIFKEYFEEYTKFKKAPKGRSGNGGLTMDDLSLVAGVNTDNNIVECLSLTEFSRQVGLELVQERKLEKGYDGPSF